MVAVGAIIEHALSGKILVIQRAKNLDWRGGEWETLYGRLDQFEDPHTGLKREVREEVGITDLEIHELFRAWHIFRGLESAENELIGLTYHTTTQTETIQLSTEHETYRWVTPQEALELIDVVGIRKDIELFIEYKNRKVHKRGHTLPGVAVGAMIFNDAGELFLAKRGVQAQNEKGCWEIPGGAVEFGETLRDAIRREIKEEYGIEIEVEKQFVAVDHILQQEGQHWVPTCFTAKIVGDQQPRIMEPEKCEAIGWFALDALPAPLSEITKLDLASYHQS